MRSKTRIAAIKALLEGGSYRDTVEETVVMDAFEDMPDLPLSPMIRNKEHYRKWRDSDRTDPNPR